MKKKDDENKLPMVADVQLAAENQRAAVSKIISKFTPNFEIKTTEDAMEVSQDLKIIKTTFSQVDDLRKKYTKPLDDMKKFFMDLFRPVALELEDAENRAKRAILAYQQEERRKAEEVAKSEREQQEAARKIEEERLRKEQEKADLLEDEEASQAIEQQKAALDAIPVSIPPPLPPQKIGGISSTKIWKGDVIDLIALAKHIVETGENSNLIIPNTKDIGALAKATKGTLNIPGIRFYAEDSLSVR